MTLMLWHKGFIMAKISDYSLYLVISEEASRGMPAERIAELAVSSGVDIIQMREKNKSREQLLKLGKKIHKICKNRNVPFIVNDDPLLAKDIDADGVHMGQGDLRNFSIEEIRRIIGKDKIVGVSTHSLDQFNAAVASCADYIAFGPVFKTPAKDYFLGTKDISAVLKNAKKPVFFIGGVTLDNLDKLLELGVKNIALIRDIIQAEDISGRVASYKEKINSYKKSSGFINVRVNGKNESVLSQIDLRGFVLSKGLQCERIVLELNSRIVPKQEWQGIKLSESDTLEIISFVGGG